MKIERASAGDWAELMDVLNTSFRVAQPDHPPFDRFLPDIYEPTDECMSRHRIVRTDGQIAAAVGLYPVRLKLGSVVLDIAGVGGVATRPEYRGRGLMTSLMTQVSRDIKDAGYSLSWLAGLRDRYARFGWEKAGSDVVASFRASPGGSASGGWSISRCDPLRDDLNEMFAAHQRLEYRGECSHDVFRKKCRSCRVQLYEARSRNSRAYLTLNEHCRWVVEWGGDIGGVDALMQSLCSAATWSVRLPPIRDRWAELFLSKGETSAPEPDNLAVFDLQALLRAFADHLTRSWPRDRRLTLKMDPGGGYESGVLIEAGHVVEKLTAPSTFLRLDRLKTVSLLFGPAKPSELLKNEPEAHWLDEAFPLPFYMPSLFRV